MNVDRILGALNEQCVDYILFGGMNFLLRHVPELTFDVDIWVRDNDANLELRFQVLSDEHMLACQEALPAEQRKENRMKVLRDAIHQRRSRWS